MMNPLDYVFGSLPGPRLSERGAWGQICPWLNFSLRLVTAEA